MAYMDNFHESVYYEEDWRECQSQDDHDVHLRNQISREISKFNFPSDSDEPESVYIDITAKENKHSKHQDNSERWIFAETWWADVFDKPTFLKLAKWIFKIGPWLAISHVARRDRLEPTNKLWHRIRVLLAIVFAFAVQVFILILSVIALIPIPKLRRSLSGLLSTLSATIGDAYILVSSPIQKTLAMQKVLDGIAYLSKECDAIVVIAHSQGAAITSEVLSYSPETKVKKLITVGSGVSKLQLLMEMVRQEKRKIFDNSKSNMASMAKLASYATPLFFILVFGLLTYKSTLPWLSLSQYIPADLSAHLSKEMIVMFDWAPTMLIMFCIPGYFFIASIYARKESIEYAQRIKDLCDRIAGKGIEWVNIYSKNDPV